jgi:hypothetical protein
MCEPTTIATIAASALTAIGGYAEASAVAEQQRIQQQQLYDSTKIEADRAARLELEAIARRKRERDKANVLEKTRAEIAIEQAAASAQVSAAEAGVSGVSIKHLMRDYYDSLSKFNVAINMNADAQVQQDLADAQAIDAKRRARINRATPGGVQDPNILPYLGTFAGQSLDTYSAYKAGKKKPPSTVPDQTNQFRRYTPPSWTQGDLYT